MFHKRIAASEYRRGVNDGKLQKVQEVLSSREEADRKEKEYHVGKPVILIPNEWDNPTIGFVTNVVQVGAGWAIVVNDLFEDREVLSFAKPMSFSEQKMFALSRLNPYERWAIHAVNAVGEQDFDKPKSGQALEGVEFIRFIQESDFWPRWLEFKANMQKEQACNLQGSSSESVSSS